LLEAGQALLAKGGFDDVSIAQIAGHAGCSVGAFYLRFKDKEVFFQCLLDGVVDAIKAEISATVRTATVHSASAMPPSLADTVHFCVAQYIGLYRRHEGLIRTAQQQNMHHRENWQLIQALGQWVVTQFTELMAHRFPESDNDALRHNVTIGFQIIGGHLLNAIMNKPALLGLASDPLQFWMSEVVLHCIQVKRAPAPLSVTDSTQFPKSLDTPFTRNLQEMTP
jgi:AcrR family transcriptional regulator